MHAMVAGLSPLVRSPPISSAGAITAISARRYCSTAFTPSVTKLRFRSPARPKLLLGSSSVAPLGRKFTLRCSAINEIGESDFQSTVLKSSRPVLVEFVATWCGPCRLIAPAMESIAEEYGDRLVVVKIDHDANPGLIKEYGVYGLPTLILFKDGKEVPNSKREGAVTKPKLKEYLDALLETISVA